MRIASTLFRGTAENVARAATKAWLPFADDAIIMAEDLAHMARRRKSARYALFDLQLYLVNSARTELLTLRSVREARKEDPSDKNLNYLEQSTRMSLNAFEQIANGIAYRFFDYNHSLAQSLWGNQSSLFNIFSEGFINSTQVAAAYNDQPTHNRQILLSDITSLINVGDFLIKDNDSYEIIEVKMGENASGSKVRRQKSRVKEAVEFLTVGKRIADGDEINAISVPARRHHLHALSEALEAADKEGACVRHVNPCSSVAGVEGDQLNEKIEEVISQTLNGRDSSSCWVIPSVYAREKEGMTAPFTIYPITSRHVIDLLYGLKVAFFCVDFSAIEERLSSAGWNVGRNPRAFGKSGTTPTDNDVNIFTLWKDSNVERNLGVHIDFIYSCAVELMDFDSYVETLKILWDKCSDGKRSKWTCFYDDESHLWN